MKKYLFSLLAIMMVAIVGFGFASCSSDDDGDDSNNSFVGTWRKYSSTNENEFKNVIWVFEKNMTMYEHDVDDNLKIIEGKTETFKYKTEKGHLYTQKQKEGKQYDWEDEGAYNITGDILTLTKDSGKIHRLKKIK